MSKDFLNYLGELKKWIKSLDNSMESTYEQIVETIEGRISLPDNCPSQEALIEMQLQSVKGGIEEVNGMFKKVIAELSE